MTTRLRELAALIQAELVGHPAPEVGADPQITGVAPLSDVQAGQLTFLEDEKYIARVVASPAAGVIVARKIAPELLQGGPVQLRVADPLGAFITLFQHFHPARREPEPAIDPTARIHPSTRVGAGVHIGPYVTVGENCVIGDGCRIHPGVAIGNDCELGEQTTLYPHAVLYDRCVLGKRVIIHAHAVLGADGFGYRLHQGRHVKIPQLGRVELGDDVEVGACTTIDRATFAATTVAEGSKIDNLVMVGHNCHIGKHNLIVSQVGIAGSVTTGNYVVMAGQVGIADHLTIHDGAMLGAKCGVMKDVPAGVQLHGIPGRPAKEQLRIVTTLELLPEMRKDIKKLKDRLGLGERPDQAAEAPGEAA